LHVLGTPPALILSQDQTLMLKMLASVTTVHDAGPKPCPTSGQRHRQSLQRDSLLKMAPALLSI
jgi:hypothetical protein